MQRINYTVIGSEILSPGSVAKVTAGERHEHLEDDFAKFWLPDAYEFVEEIPKTATGKFLKLKLRERFKVYTVSSG